MLTLLPYVFVGFLGLAVGSFLNVVVFRFGFEESPQARSHCMACGEAIAAYDLVPVISFFFLGGRCRACGSKLSFQYPAIELLTAGLFLCAYATLTPELSVTGLGAFAALLGFLASLVALTTYDIRHTVVPMPFVYALYAFSAGAAIIQSVGTQSYAPLLDSIAGAVVLAGFFYAIYALTRGRGMGLGDAYVAGAVGLLLGLTRGIEAVMLSFWIGTAVYLPLYLLSSLGKKTRLFAGFARVTIKTELPFVPFLALGVVVALFTTLSPLSFGAWLANTVWFHSM